MTARHDAVDDVGAGVLDLLPFGRVGVVGLLLAVPIALGGARHVRQNEVRAAFELRQVADELLVLELVERAIAVGAVGLRLLRQRRHRLDHLPGEILAQLVVYVVDASQQDVLHAAEILAAVQLMGGRLRRQDPTVEIGRHQAEMRAQLDDVGYEGSERQRLKRGTGCPRRCPALPPASTRRR
jgi:hypothetical protein